MKIIQVEVFGVCRCWRCESSVGPRTGVESFSKQMEWPVDSGDFGCG
jgi:hypothetical protein